MKAILMLQNTDIGLHTSTGGACKTFVALPYLVFNNLNMQFIWLGTFMYTQPFNKNCLSYIVCLVPY